ncbi:hypothetical protein ACCE15_14455 [Pseudomonas parafulva]|uniref:hypothetical protein n=1 Tax=Pseudomonas TaxID=286 RepID=UPI0006D3C84C|nr:MULTISPECIES: hypothetical protein [Pseudomonas]KAB5625089.1 hypothetical protein F7234_04625 [Pseudomonas putida]RSC26293.1 hypothetical protein EGT09_07660 [Pseudomonas putida]
MGNQHNTLPALLVLACLAATSIAPPALAGGNGVIVLNRDVQPRQADRRTGTPDPYPTTANTNESARIQAQTNNELTDGDFASVASGSTVSRIFQPDNSGNLRGMGTAQSQLPGMPGGSGAGASGANSISNTVNQNVQRGMAPLQILTRGQ